MRLGLLATLQETKPIVQPSRGLNTRTESLDPVNAEHPVQAGPARPPLGFTMGFFPAKPLAGLIFLLCQCNS